MPEGEALGAIGVTQITRFNSEWLGFFSNNHGGTGCPFTFSQGNVGNAFGVQIKHAEFIPFFDQIIYPRQEHQLEAQKRVQHAD